MSNVIHQAPHKHVLIAKMGEKVVGQVMTALTMNVESTIMEHILFIRILHDIDYDRREMVMSHPKEFTFEVYGEPVEGGDRLLGTWHFMNFECVSSKKDGEISSVAICHCDDIYFTPREDKANED